MSEPTVAIGRMVQELQKEFPSVTISKIRFFEAKGLISPERSTSGYRRFTSELTARIHEMLRLQRDEYLPLDVIASRMERWSSDATDVTPTQAGPYTVAELAKATGTEPSLIEDLTKHGVLVRDPDGYPTNSASIVSAAHQVLSLGLEPRHLRSVRTTTSSLAEVLRGRTQALRRSSKASAEAELRELVRDAVNGLTALTHEVASDEFERLANT